MNLTPDLPPLENRASLDSGTLLDLWNELRALRGLDDVVRWGKGRVPIARITSVTVQDEFTHDVVMPLSENLILVFDTT